MRFFIEIPCKLLTIIEFLSDWRETHHCINMLVWPHICMSVDEYGLVYGHVWLHMAGMVNSMDILS